jgi:hypothetical protein
MLLQMVLACDKMILRKFPRLVDIFYGL